MKQCNTCKNSGWLKRSISPLYTMKQPCMKCNPKGWVNKTLKELGDSNHG